MVRLSPTARSIFAVVDGLLLFFAVDAIFYLIAFLGLHRSFDTPTPLYLGCNLLWTMCAALLGGYTTGRVALRSPILHGVIAAIPLLLLAILNLYKGVGDRRTPFVLAYNLLVPLAFLLGAWLLTQRRPGADTTPHVR